jgi:hypothetical protein
MMWEGRRRVIAHMAKELLESEGTRLADAEISLLQQSSVWPNVWAESVSALLFQRAIRDYARAIDKASTASDRHASALVRATWALFAATAVLLSLFQQFSCGCCGKGS